MEMLHMFSSAWFRSLFLFEPFYGDWQVLPGTTQYYRLELFEPSILRNKLLILNLHNQGYYCNFSTRTTCPLVSTIQSGGGGRCTMGISAMQRLRRASPVLSGDWPRRCLWELPCTSAPVPAAARLPWPLESTIRSAASAPCGPAPPPPSYESPLTPPSGERPICRSQVRGEQLELFFLWVAIRKLVQTSWLCIVHSSKIHFSL
jgi:hypothetical protein